MQELTTSLYEPEILQILRNSKDRRCEVTFIEYSLRKKQFSYCAMGTILHHYNVPNWQLFSSIFASYKFRQIFGRGKKKPKMECPDCSRLTNFYGLLAHLNDTHKLPWGKIADNLEKATPYDFNKPWYRIVWDVLR